MNCRRALPDRSAAPDGSESRRSWRSSRRGCRERLRGWCIRDLDSDVETDSVPCTRPVQDGGGDEVGTWSNRDGANTPEDHPGEAACLPTFTSGKRLPPTTLQPKHPPELDGKRAVYTAASAVGCLLPVIGADRRPAGQRSRCLAVRTPRRSGVAALRLARSQAR